MKYYYMRKNELVRLLSANDLDSKISYIRKYKTATIYPYAKRYGCLTMLRSK